MPSAKRIHQSPVSRGRKILEPKRWTTICGSPAPIESPSAEIFDLVLKSLCKCVEDSPPNVVDVLVVAQVLRAPRPTRMNWLLTIDEFRVLNGTDVRIKIPCVRLKTLIVA